MVRKVLIVEPSEVIIAGLQSLLHDNDRLRLLQPEHNTSRLSERLMTSRPDVVLINPTLPHNIHEIVENGHTAVVALVYQYVEPSVLRLYDDVIDIRDAGVVIADTLMRSGKNRSEDDNAEVASNYELTKRETAVLVQVALGKTNKEIADALCVSVHTVISHRKNIIHKTGIKSVAGLTVYAMLNNLIDQSQLL